MGTSLKCLSQNQSPSSPHSSQEPKPKPWDQLLDLLNIIPLKSNVRKSMVTSRTAKKVFMSLWAISVTLPKVSRDPRMLPSSLLLRAFKNNSIPSINHLVITWNHSWHHKENGISMSPLLTSLDLQ